MKELWQRYGKQINFFGGLLVLLLTVILYFFDTKTVAVSMGKSASEQRMERAYNSSNTIKRSSKEEKKTPIFAKKLQSSEQGKNFLLFLMILGFSMLLHSLYSKYKSEKLEN